MIKKNCYTQIKNPSYNICGAIAILIEEDQTDD